MHERLVPTESELHLLAGLRFIKEHRQENLINEIQDDLNLQRAFAEKLLPLTTGFTEDSMILADILDVAELFPKECVDVLVEHVNKNRIVMSGTLLPNWRIEAESYDKRRFANLFLVLAKGLQVPIKQNFFEPHTLLKFISQAEAEKDTKAKKIVLESLSITATTNWDNRRNIYRARVPRRTPEQNAIIKEAADRINENIALPIRIPGYRIPRHDA